MHSLPTSKTTKSMIIEISKYSSVYLNIYATRGKKNEEKKEREVEKKNRYRNFMDLLKAARSE